MSFFIELSPAIITCMFYDCIKKIYLSHISLLKSIEEPFLSQGTDKFQVVSTAPAFKQFLNRQEGLHHHPAPLPGRAQVQIHYNTTLL